MIKENIVIFLWLSLLSNTLPAQANGKKFGISLNINYTTTSRLYLQPNAADPFIRNTHENLDGIRSYSLEARYQLTESIIIGIGSEVIEKTFGNSINLGGIRAEMNDGYKMIPVEISAYYLIPFSNDRFRFFMGGGVGLYFGRHLRELGDVTINNDSPKAGYGIHVAVGMDFIIYDFISFRGQMRFRDPEFEMTSSYSSGTVNYRGETYPLKPQSFNSKADIDGLVFTIGVAFNF
ncbi:MAG: outer membrane beta-barrel protein [Melioribacteraceae bacterium]